MCACSMSLEAFHPGICVCERERDSVCVLAYDSKVRLEIGRLPAQATARSRASLPGSLAVMNPAPIALPKLLQNF